MIEGSRTSNMVLLGGTQLVINNALLSTKYRRNLLSFRYIQQNKYYIEIINERNNEYLYITMVSISIYIHIYHGKITIICFLFVLQIYKSNWNKCYTEPKFY